MDERTLRTLEFAKIKEMLAERTATSLGREVVESLAPATDFLEVQHRQAETSEARRLYEGGHAIPLGGLRDLRAHVQRAVRGGVLDPGDLLDVADTAASSRRLKRFLEEQEGLPILTALSRMLGTFHHLEAEIRQAVDEHGEVRDDASPALAEIRRSMRILQNRMKERLDAFVRGSAAKYLQDPIVTIREGRFVVPVKIEYRAQVPGIVHDQSASGSTLFIEPMAIVEMNNDLRELALKEREEVERILARLSSLVAGEADALLDTLQAVAQIDFASAKGKLSLDLDCTEPELVREPILEIHKGRHPLLKGRVVPIDVHIGITFDTLVITGPNTGGKTVALKTMGLFVLMAQAGLHLPAGHGTRVGVFQQVFVDIGDEQSIEQSLSTFSGHMTNIIRILDALDGPALVLLDELGAGTDPTEGAALAMSILEHLHRRGAKTVATTHYSELKTYAYTRSRVENASVEFDVETLQPTFRLLIGVPGSSNAFEISRRLGLSPHIVDRARQFLTKEQERVEDLIQGIHATRAELEKELAEARRLRAEAQRMRDEYERRYGDAKAKAAATVEKARAQAQQILATARREAEAVIAELKQALRAQREAERMQTIQSARSRLARAREAVEPGEEELRARRRGEVPRGLKPGDAVRIVSLDTKGHVLAEPDADGNVLVQAGIIKLTVALDDLERAEEEQPAAAARAAAGGRTGGKGLAVSKAREMSPEVDLRGLMVDEALERVDKFLDDAMLAGLPQVRIIHGKGTGALRKAVTEALRRDRRVESYRLGGIGEGGDGVTVAKLRE
ncbi:endonuclease MutS2 [Symbiobacterium thermophilum]|uniref:Endonuclease MutS2 n=1 Tax=Symbiobacterium thermophilum TaxID=2734 RepID=A0A953LGA1_SYMTR|nr:endonuclease MutS2 [Symbiobacterium thermophilum]MBY6275046.1 endonuclease MutS2 [Symbiobacterium thermophilum]